MFALLIKIKRKPDGTFAKLKIRPVTILKPASIVGIEAHMGATLARLN